MPFTIAAVISLFGEESYPFKMVVVGVLMWSTALAVLVLLTPPAASTPASIAIVSSFLLFPALREWNFGFGSLMAETCSHVFFTISLAALFVALRRRSPAWAIAGAALFALAAYYRSAFELQGRAFFAALSIIAGGWLLFERTPRMKRLAGCALAAMLTFNVALVPWRLYKERYFGTTAWYSAADAYVYGFLWKKDEELRWYHRGANAACHADPDLCRELHDRGESLTGLEIKEAAFRTLSSHPFIWLKFKAENLCWLWFDRSWTGLASEPIVLLEGLVLALLGVFGFSAMALRAKRTPKPEAIGMLLMAVLLVGINAAIFLILHFEWRYSQTLRTLCLLLPVFWLWSKGPSRFVDHV
jgi:hypothetical protein